jgi:hypothetical protein
MLYSLEVKHTHFRHFTLYVYFFLAEVELSNVKYICKYRLVSPFLQATKVLRESRGIALLCFLDLGCRMGDGSASRSGRFLPPGKTRYPLYRRLGGSQGRSGQVRKIFSPPGFDPRTVQPVASRYTD